MVALPIAGALGSWHGMVERAMALESGKLRLHLSWTYDHRLSPSPLCHQFYHLWNETDELDDIHVPLILRAYDFMTTRLHRGRCSAQVAEVV